MSKKFLPLISLLLVAVFVLSACGPAATEAPVATEAPTEAPVATEAPTEAPTEVVTEAPAAPVTITMWHSKKESETASFNDVVAAFQAANPNVKVELLFVPDADLRGKFETAAGSGEGPTLLLGAADWGPAMYKAMLLADLTAQMPADLLAKVNPAALASVQYDGALVGMPWNVKGVVLYRNKSIVADAPTSLDDFIAKAKAAKSGDVEGAVFEYGPFFSWGHLYATGTALMDAKGDPTFNDANGIAFLDAMKKIKAEGISMTFNTDDDVNLFKTGKAGMIIDGSWNLGDLSKALGENLVVDVWPAGMSGFVQNDNIYVNANASEEQVAAAASFIQFLLTPEAQAFLMDPTKANSLPVISGMEITDPLAKQVVAALAGGVAFPVIPELNAYWGPFETALKQVVEEGADSKTALQTAYDAIVAALPEIRK